MTYKPVEDGDTVIIKDEHQRIYKGVVVGTVTTGFEVDLIVDPYPFDDEMKHFVRGTFVERVNGLG